MQKRLLPLAIIIIANIVVFEVNAQVGKVGINTTTPLAMLHVQDSSVLFAGPSNLAGSFGLTPVSGAGIRMMWYPDKAAFRTGRVSGTHWNRENIGIYSFATGFDTKASGQYAFAAGYVTTASGTFSTALGENTIASGSYSTALGNSTIASGSYSSSIGNGTNAKGSNSASLGFSTQANGFASTVIGLYNDTIVATQTTI
ncbi:MAG: hypothetical protein M3R25_08845, partial [Bacteroidota bacterium]|nr:hypothetical protein [Bacteroidota bacterium]